MVVAVTGASGFVGRTLLAALGETPGLVAHPVSRTDGGPDLETASPHDWQRALAGAQICIHLASRLPWGGDNARRDAQARFMDVNAKGSERVFQGFRAAGGQHFVFLSTAGINGTVSGSKPFRASDPPRPVGNYATSKLEGEKQLSSLAAESGLALTILRAPLIYGAGVAGRFSALVAYIRKGGLLPLGGLDNHRDLIGARNLADLLVAVVQERTKGLYLVRDRDPVSSTRLVKQIAEAFGTTPRLVGLPPLIRSMAMRLPVAGPVAARLFGDFRIDDAPIERTCPWTPRYNFADEIHAMARSGT